MRRRRQRTLLIGIVPLVAATLVIALILRDAARRLAAEEIATIEAQLIAAKQRELVNYMSLALTSISLIYDKAAPGDMAAREEAQQVLSRLAYQAQGYFFAYDINGQTLIHPRPGAAPEEAWLDVADPSSPPAVREMLEQARTGGALPAIFWDIPAQATPRDKITYAVSLDKWNWVLGTAVYVEDVLAELHAVETGVHRRIDGFLVTLALVTLGCLGLVFVGGQLVALRERIQADRRQRVLTQRVIDAQEEERGRVARELHDGISQILVSARFGIEKARMRLSVPGVEPDLEALDRVAERLALAIGEVRRISRDLRPAMLDDLGLSAAIEALTDDFSERTGIAVELKWSAFKNLMRPDAKTALYRVAQEALTNVERHAKAGRVTISLQGEGGWLLFRIEDDGGGFRGSAGRRAGGIGLRNMRERMERFGGSLEVSDTGGGLRLEARLPARLLEVPPGVGEGGLEAAE